MRNFQWNKSKDGVWRGRFQSYPVVAEARIQPHREGFWFEVSVRRGQAPVRAACGFRHDAATAKAMVSAFAGCKIWQWPVFAKTDVLTGEPLQRR